MRTCSLMYTLFTIQIISSLTFLKTTPKTFTLRLTTSHSVRQSWFRDPAGSHNQMASVMCNTVGQFREHSDGNASPAVLISSKDQNKPIPYSYIQILFVPRREHSQRPLERQTASLLQQEIRTLYCETHKK